MGVSFAGTKIAHRSSYQALMERKAEIADHFRRRSIAQGQDGNFGALFTHHLRLRNIYAGLCSLIDNPNLSFLLEGATGTGKDRMIQEFVRLENVYRKLLGLEQARFCKVSEEAREDVLSTLLKETPKQNAIFYFTSLESFSLHEQEILSELLQLQDCREQPYRLIFGCQESLAFMVQRGKILSDIVQSLQMYSFSLPRLKDRNEDFPHLLGDFIHRYTNKRDFVRHEALEKFTKLEYPYNLDSLSGVIRKALALNPHPSQWSAHFIESIYPHSKPERTEKILDFTPGLRYQ